MFKNAILKLKKEKEVYRKRLQRHEQTLKISPKCKTKNIRNALMLKIFEI